LKGGIETVIRVRELEFRYPEGEFCLRVPDLEIAQGSQVAFIGPSGCGKTTLLNLIAGITVPRSGQIESSGIEITNLSDGERREFRIKQVGLVFQEFELLDYLNVLDNILLPYRINPSLVMDATVKERAAGLARDFGIADKLRRFPRRLSQGERQRVAVCRAVLTEPSLLLADEPTGNLDPVNTEHVLDIVFGYAKRAGATLLTVTHDHTLLSRFERVIDFKDFHGGPG
jgi:ABC-type lipoprotein export system ATPase subunit